MKTWQQRATALADELVTQGKLTSPEWIAAVRSVPRHVLVPHYYDYDRTASKWVSVDSAHDDLEKVYSNTGLYTKIGSSNSVTPLSSTSTPGLMARMLEMLNIREGHRVLEVGTGTGYNAALLAHRLGAANVFSVDIDAELVALARERLASLGYYPTLAAVDGANGMPKHAPFDRIIATCAVPAVPWPWVEQVTDGGLILVDIKRGIAAGNLILLHRHGHYAEGRFDARWANFMTIRRPQDQQPGQRPDRNRDSVTPRPTPISEPPWEQPTWWFLASLTVSRR
ncbi:MAG TPA: methyltransferase domain-containing protein [Pseudonocardiaceae bacterium]|nr:methyltransferase domain-containing protein [Pseudonocardiaceae bacterium]